MSHVSNNHTGALLLAAAVAKVFPKEQIYYSAADSQGFSVEFTYSEPFSETFLPLLENTMKALSQEEVQVMEMLASNAREYLAHKGQKKLSETLQGVEGTVEIAQIGDCICLTTGPLEKCHYFSLFEFEQGKKIVTVSGMSFPDANERKVFLKKYREYPEKNHEFLAKELELYEDGIWHPRGVALRQVLMDFWRQYLGKGGFVEIIAPDPKAYYSKTGRKKFSIWSESQDLSFCSLENSLISSLQFIQKWINIFDFECSWVLQQGAPKALREALAKCGIDYLLEEGGDPTKLEVRIADSLGRYWTGPVIAVKKGELQFSLFGDLNRFIALLLERYEGSLPFWVCPEQVRLFPLAEVDLDPVIKIFNRQNIRYVVDEEPVLFKEKMHRALRSKVPYVMVFGKREENAQQIAIRASGSSLDETMTLEKMEQFLVERKVEN